MADVEDTKDDIVTEKQDASTEVQKEDNTANSSPVQVKTNESVIDYAKNTMNSFLSMYGYEESMTTEALKSKIKSEPSSPDKEKTHSYSADVTSAHIASKKTEDIKKDVNTSSPRTATVMPIQSTSKTDRGNTMELVNSNVGAVQNNGAGGRIPLSAPRKPVTPYMRYRNMIFEEIKHKYPGCSPYDLACLISSKWSMLTDSERKVWEDQYEQEVREYSVNLKEYSETIKNIFKSTDPTSPAPHIKGGGSPEETKTPVRRGSCNWCKKQAVLLDFSSVLDGREIYCTGLCSDKCFTEAAKQIVTIENGNAKPRYISGNRTQSQSSREVAGVASFTPVTQYPPVTSTTDTTSTASSSSFQVFDWDQYLIETRSSAAPWLYFKQCRYPPSNNFVVGMKLEACNGQTILGYSLATVVAICGARILLHFDGSDASSDIWRLPDSGDIHPVGWTEASQLKPPTGYKYDYTKYRRFHASSLQNAEIAPARLFKKEPRAPIENYFIAGMKLEAVDKQNPAVIRVATVIDTDDERIRVEFDGCKGSGYWCHYSDRDLFPAGWCSRSGHPLKPPGSTDTKSYMIGSQGSSSPSMVSTSSESRSSSGSPYVLYPNSTSAPKEGTWKDKNTASGNNVEIFINTDCYCGPYLDSRKLEQMQHVYRGSIVTVLKSVLEDTIRCAVDSKTVFGFLKPGRGNCIVTATCDGMTYQCCLNSIDRVSTFWRVLEQFSDNLRSCSNLFSSVDYRLSCNRCNRTKSTGTSSEPHTNNKGSMPSSIYTLNSGRRTESKSNNNNNELHKSVSRQDSPYETSTYNVSMYDPNRDDSDVVQPRQDTLHQEAMRQESIHQETLCQESLRQESLRHNLLRQESLRHESLTQDSLRQDSLSRQESLQQDSLYETRRQESYSSENSKDDTIHNPVIVEKKYENDGEKTSIDEISSPPEKRKRVRRNEVSGVEIKAAPKTWSIQQVIMFIEQTDLKDNVDKFKDNEIDGKALLLLKRDLVLSHMGFKLGPAVKLLDIIDELRIVQEKLQ